MAPGLLTNGKPLGVHDLEMLLSRAVQRVLSDGGDSKSTYTISNVPDMNLELRSLAVQLYRRAETRADKRLQDQRDRDKVALERRLNDVQKEFEYQFEVKKRELERDRASLSAHFQEKERRLQTSVDLKLLDCDGRLDMHRQLLDNRFAELRLNKEIFDRQKQEFQNKMTADLEAMRLEREQIAGLRCTDIGLKSEDEIRQTARLKMLEADNADLKKREELLRRNNEILTEKLEQLENVQQELETTRSVLVKESATVRSLRQELRVAGDVVGMKEELTRLATENTRLVAANMSHAKAVAAIAELRTSLEISENRVKELHLGLTVLNEKLRVATSERDFLRSEMRSLRRENLRRVRSNVEENSVEKAVSKRAHFPVRSSVSSSDDTASEASSRTEVRGITKRMTNLNQMAKNLDASVEQYIDIRRAMESSRNAENRIEKLHQNYDIGRNIYSPGQQVNIYGNPKAPKEDQCLSSNYDDQIKEGQIADNQSRSTAALVDSAVSRAYLGSDSNSGEILHQNWKESDRKLTSPKESRLPQKDFAIYQNTEINCDSQADNTRKDSVSDSFVERLKNRNVQQHRRSFADVLESAETETKILGDTEEKETKNASPKEMFEGVDPVVAEYMKLVMQRKTEEKKAVQDVPREFVDEPTPKEDAYFPPDPPDSDGDIEW